MLADPCYLWAVRSKTNAGFTRWRNVLVAFPDLSTTIIRLSDDDPRDGDEDEDDNHHADEDDADLDMGIADRGVGNTIVMLVTYDIFRLIFEFF